MSEPEAGTDVGNLSTRAKEADGGFLINGQKTWITSAHVADHILLVCRTDTSGSKYDGLSMISVPQGTDGMEIRGIDTMVGHEVNDIYFTDCFVPASNVVGEVGGGWMQLMAGLNYERVILGATSIGLAIRAFEDVVSYVRERKVFGRAVGSFQIQRHRLAHMATEIECTRAFVHDIARRIDAEPDRMLPRRRRWPSSRAPNWPRWWPWSVSR